METTTTPAESIPMFRELLVRRDLSWAAVLVYGALAQLDRGEGVVLPVREIARITGLAPGGSFISLRGNIQSLVDRGLLLKTQPDGYPLRYTVLGPRLYSTCSTDTHTISESVSESTSHPEA